MPNWVHNTITIKGTDKDLQEVYEKLKSDSSEEPVTFRGLIPMPDECTDWYNWCITNWGTKWDACHSGYEAAEGTATYYFDTAWSPPEPVINAFLDQFPNVDMCYTYREEQGWGGALDTVKGKVVNSNSYDVPDSHAEMVKSQGWCYCENSDEAAFGDCYGERASRIATITADTKEVAKALSPDWSGTFDELIETSTIL